MTTQQRRSARGQTLPPEEIQILRDLRGFNLYARSAQLFRAGWTLRAIGEAFEPPKSRSTVRSWVDRALDSAPTLDLPPVKSPTLATPEVYVPTKPKSPGISPAELAQIEALAPIARKYRSGMLPTHRASIARDDLTALCTTLFEKNVTIQELATAANVTYRAMAKRLGRA